MGEAGAEGQCGGARGKLLAMTAHAAKYRTPLKLIDRYVGWQVLLTSTIVSRC